MALKKKTLLARTGATPGDFAEELAERMSAYPWPMTIFFERHPNQAIKMHALRAGSAECERFRRANSGFEAGTYTRAASYRELREDFTYAMGQV